jgi:hypothetical protein
MTQIYKQGDVWKYSADGIFNLSPYVGIGTIEKLTTNSKLDLFNASGADLVLGADYDGSIGTQQRIGSFDILNKYNSEYFRFVMRYRQEGGTFRHQIIQTVYDGTSFSQLFFYDVLLKILRFGNSSVETTFEGNAEFTGTQIKMTNLPTSSAGLPTGAVWNDAGTLKIV